MDFNSGITVLDSAKERCLLAEYISDLYIVIDSVESVLLKFQYTKEHPFYIRIVKIQEHFASQSKNGIYEIGIIPARKMVTDVINSIIIELKAECT